MKHLILILILTSLSFGQSPQSRLLLLFDDDEVDTTPPAFLQTDGNTLVWYAYDSLSTITKDANNRVQYWDGVGASGTTYRLAASDTAYYPLWTENGIVFDGVNDGMSKTFTLDVPAVLYIAFIQHTTVPGSYIVGSGTSGHIRVGQGITEGDINLYGNSNSQYAASRYVNVPLNTTGILRVSVNGESSFIRESNTQREYMYSDRTAFGGLAVGCRATNSNTSNVTIKEIIIRDSLDTPTNELAIYNYLKNKYEVEQGTPEVDFTIISPYPIAGFEGNQYKGNLHGHTTNSIDGNDTPEKFVEAYRDSGYDFIAITDHDYLTPDPEVADILFISGVEEGADDPYTVHINSLFATAEINSKNVQIIMDSIKTMSGIIGLNHPNHVTLTWTLSRMQQWNGYNYFVEAYNAVDEVAFNRWDSLLVTGARAYGMAADDCHDTSAATFGNSYVMILADSLSEESVYNALSNGEYYFGKSGLEFNNIQIVANGRGIKATRNDTGRIYFYGAGVLNQVGYNAAATQSYIYYPRPTDKFVRIMLQNSATGLYSYSNPFYIVPK